MGQDDLLSISVDERQRSIGAGGGGGGGLIEHFETWTNGRYFSDNIFQNILWKEIYAFGFNFHEKLSIKTCSQ